MVGVDTKNFVCQYKLLKCISFGLELSAACLRIANDKKKLILSVETSAEKVGRYPFNFCHTGIFGKRGQPRQVYHNV